MLYVCVITQALEALKRIFGNGDLTEVQYGIRENGKFLDGV